MLFENARFFVMKSDSFDNIDISYKFSVWATTLRPTKTLAAALTH